MQMPYFQGHAAWSDDVPRCANPYGEQTIAGAECRDGWMDAGGGVANDDIGED